jgi:hypothetical protein
MDLATIKRANERIDELESAIARFDDDTVGVNENADSQERVPKFRTNEIPEVVANAATAAIAAVFGNLTPTSGGVHAGISRSPPKWWSDLVKALRENRHEHAESGGLLRAIAVLEPHIRENTSLHVVGLVFLATDIDRKLRLDTHSQGFRGEREPHPQKTVVVFDPEIDDYVRDTLHKSHGEILPFPERCDAFLRHALNDIRDMLD